MMLLGSFTGVNESMILGLPMLSPLEFVILGLLAAELWRLARSSPRSFSSSKKVRLPVAIKDQISCRVRIVDRKFLDSQRYVRDAADR